MSRRKKAIDYIVETVDLALKHPEHGRGGDLVGDVAAKMFGDTCIPFDRFAGWKPSRVRLVVIAYAEMAPSHTLAEMLREARYARAFLYDFAFSNGYETETHKGCYGPDYQRWRRKHLRAGTFRQWHPDAAKRRAA